MLTLVSALTQWRHRRRGRSLSSRQRGLARHRVPPGLDTEQFLSLARMSFLRLQTAWDAGDLAELQRLTTGPLLAELREQIEARGGGINRTEVIDLQARLLAFEELGEAFVASVEFSGLVREYANAAPADFRELWLLTHLKPIDESLDSPASWQLAQVQALA